MKRKECEPEPSELFILNKEAYDQILKEITCSICLEPFKDVVSTNCSHYFCEQCIIKCLKGTQKSPCPLCKSGIFKRDLTKCDSLQNIITALEAIEKVNVVKPSLKKSKRNDYEDVEDQLQSSSYLVIPTKPLISQTVTVSQKTKLSSQKSQPSVSRPFHGAINIMGTSVDNYVTDEINKFCSLYNAKFHKNFVAAVTHVIVSPIKEAEGKIQARRTFKYLLAVAKGAWILSYRWVIDSIVKNQVQSEENYEITEDNYGVGAAKGSRENKGMGDFLEGLNFWVTAPQTPQEKGAGVTRMEMKKLIEMLGGRVVLKHIPGPDNYAIVLQNREKDKKKSKREYTMKKDMLVYSHEWILDSVCHYKVLSAKDYVVDYLAGDLDP